MGEEIRSAFSRRRTQGRGSGAPRSSRFSKRRERSGRPSPAGAATLVRVRGLGPRLSRRTPEIERRRGIPEDLTEELRRTGCFRMLVPAAHGGDELSLGDVLRVIEELAVADGAIGWTVGQAALAQVILGFLPETTIGELYAGGPDLLAAGAFAPKGRAQREASGWRVSGQWPFVTGCDQASWIYLHCVVVRSRKVQMTAGGMPETRMVVLPPDEVERLDTWHGLGLRGTASQDVRVVRAFCPEDRSCAMGASPSIDSTMFRIPLMDHAGLFIASVAVGIARGALGEVAALARNGKRPTFSRHRLAEWPVFQEGLGGSHMTLRAAQSLLYEQAEMVWQASASRTALSTLERAALRATALQVTELSVRVVDWAHRSGGGSTVYDASPLQRRLRDIHTATQHAWNGRDHTVVLGSLLAGEAVDKSLFG